MDKNKFYNELKNVPPLPEGICDRVLERKRVRTMPFVLRSAAALLILGIALLYRGMFIDTEPDSFVENESALEESFSYLYEVYDNYDLLNDL